MSQPDQKRELLRHTVATLAYRGGKAVTNVPEGFKDFSINETTRTPGKILAHIGDLLDWALSMAQGNETWDNSKPKSWDDEVNRFFAALKALDDYLGSSEPLGVPAEKLFQGAIADALTHVGQINMLRRMAGGPVRGENYSRAQIVIGRVGAEQPGKRYEFG
jgi:hypothetical protein